MVSCFFFLVLLFFWFSLLPFLRSFDAFTLSAIVFYPKAFYNREDINYFFRKI